MLVLTVVLLWYTAVLTASADVDMQVAFDNGAVFERLSGIHGVDDLLLTHFITQTITGCAEHTGDRQREIERDRKCTNVQCHFTDVDSFSKLSWFSADLSSFISVSEKVWQHQINDV